MLTAIVAAVKDKIADWTQTLCKAIKGLVVPARSGTTAVAGVVRDSVKSRVDLVAENAFLRQQLIVLRRNVGRPVLVRGERVLLVLLARVSRARRDVLHIVQPDTLLRWHRDLFKIVWRRKSRPRSQPKRLARETIELIWKIASENALWGAERIRGELLKLGIRVSKRTIQKYMRQVRPYRERRQTWATFTRNHAKDIWACDFLQLYDVLFRPIFAFFIIKHDTREVVHLNVTRSPSDAWVAQQLREATPWCEGPKYLIRDNDSKYGSRFDAVAEGAGTEIIKIPPRSPDLNSLVERFLGSVRRECLDHIVILNEEHQRRVLEQYVWSYFNVARPHQGLGQRIPGQNEETQKENAGRIVAMPILGGLHHDYRRAA